jgi:putative membrane protein
MKKHIGYILKGIGMGAANVIPGVSGGTIALITGIFERLINAIKSFDIKAIKLLFGGKFKDFAKHTDLFFLLSIGLGIVVAIVTLAKLFDFLFTYYPVYIWSFFFGLVLASVYFVGKTVQKWSLSVVITFIIGTALAIFISVLNPATENTSFVYLMICGVVAMCSMILPGLSGSFVLFIMGNYKLVAIDAINDRDIGLLLPVMIGAVGGLIFFSHLLSWLLKKFKDQTISLLTGFILGSVAILWPWQKATYLMDEMGKQILKNGEPIVARYQRILPDTSTSEFWYAILFIVAGIAAIWLIEKLALQKEVN